MPPTEQLVPGHHRTNQHVAPVANPLAARRVWEIAALLSCVTIAVFWNVHAFEFVSYDDPFFVTRNQQVLAGLSWANVVWAFQSTDAFWSPMTWMSHMLDVQLYGKWAGGHHLTNLAWHVASVIVLLWAWYRLTGQIWPSALVAALFALHPLHAESVAWVSERKGILSSFFWIATLWAYAGYARRPHIGNYLLVTAAMTLGLLSKPTLVTLPCVLVLLDYWPLGRLRLFGDELSPAWPAPVPARAWWRLLLEKIPWFLLVAGFSVVAVHAEEQYGALDWLPGLTLQSRVCNAVIVYWLYLAKFVWPVGLIFFYPHPGNEVSRAAAVASAVAILLVLLIAVWQMRRRPYLLTGWLWYLGTLVPVIGLVQVGGHRMADRYTDIPLIGIAVVLAWGLAELCRRMPEAVGGVATVTTILLVSLAGMSWIQASHWHDSEALYRYTIAVDSRNWVALSNLGLWLDEAGRPDEAMEIHLRAIQANPDNPTSTSNLASALMREGRLVEAIDILEKMATKKPDALTVQANLAIAYSRSGRFDLAQRHFDEALRLGADEPNVLHNYGLFLAQQGKIDEAVAQFREAIRIRPGRENDYRAIAQIQLDAGRPADAVPAFTEMIEKWPRSIVAYEGRGQALAQLGKTDEAALDFRRALEVDSRSLAALEGLTWIFAAAPDQKRRNGAEAVRLAEFGCSLSGYKDTELLDALAAAYAEAGRFERAVEIGQQARDQARLRGDRALADSIESRLVLYRDKRPYRGNAPVRQRIQTSST